MNKRVSPAVIGAFVVASFAILVVALIVVGSGKMFTRPVRFICMFQGNLNGLKVGAPVKVRGVQIGTVAAIELGNVIHEDFDNGSSDQKQGLPAHES
jgi:ABC-type transporter Mla subunit MlaD